MSTADTGGREQSKQRRAWLSVDFYPRAGPALGAPLPPPPVLMDLSERITVIEPHSERYWEPKAQAVGDLVQVLTLTYSFSLAYSSSPAPWS